MAQRAVQGVAASRDARLPPAPRRRAAHEPGGTIQQELAQMPWSATRTPGRLWQQIGWLRWRYGLESLGGLLTTGNWRAQARYMISRSLIHGRRRAEEMREVARTVVEAGFEPRMSSACAVWQDWAAAHRPAAARFRHRKCASRRVHCHPSRSRWRLSSHSGMRRKNQWPCRLRDRAGLGRAARALKKGRPQMEA